MKKNISVVKCFDLLTIKTVHEISERLKDWNIINIISFGLCMISQRWIDCILYYNVNQSNGISIIWWLFENRDFILQRLKILLIVEVDHLLMTWKTFDRMLLRLWENFFSWAKNLDAEILLKSTMICVQNIMFVENILKNQALLLSNWKKNMKLPSSNRYSSVQCRL